MLCDNQKGRAAISYDGCPFMILGKKRLEHCQHGPDRNKSEKAKAQAEKQVFYTDKPRASVVIFRCSQVHNDDTLIEEGDRFSYRILELT